MNTMAKVLALGAVCLSASFAASADSMLAPPLTASTPYSSVELVRGASLEAKMMMTQSAGTVTVKLSDLTWSQALGSLSFSLSTSTSQLIPATNGSGVWSWHVDAPTLLYASVYAAASGPKNTGLYALNVSFVPSLGPEQTPVALPATLWMLLSGLAALSGTRFRHMAVTRGVLTSG